MDDAADQLARTLGIDGFRPGRHILRDGRGWREGEIYVEHTWHAYVLPSFHDHAVIGVAKSSDSEFRGKKIPAFFRAGIAVVSPEKKVVAACDSVSITVDPIPETLTSISLFQEDAGIWLDGIGYEVFICHFDLDVRLRFSNPSMKQWIAVESSLFSLGVLIAEHSDNPGVHQFLKEWQHYIDDR